MLRVKKTLSREDGLRLLVLSLCFVLGQLVFSVHTSPLYPHLLGTDSAIFSLLGKGLLQGKTLYLDLFDHKGPFIFFFNALGHWMGGRTGIFVLQCLMGLVSMYFLYFTLKMLRPEGLSRKMAAIIFFAGYAYFFYTFEKGNLTEEYSVPFIAWSLFLLCKYALRVGQNAKHPPLYAFFYGIAVTVLAFMRLTNAVPVCAGILVVLIYLVCKKEYKNLILNLCGGLMGIAVVAVPVVVYFWSKSALDEMIYATFLHNFQIFGTTSQDSLFSKLPVLLILYAPMAVGAFLLVHHCRSARKIQLIDLLFGGILILSFIMLWIANRFPHYFAIFMPVYVLILGRYLRFDEAKKLCVLAISASTALSLIGLGYYSYYKTVQTYFFRNETLTRYEIITEDFKIIPQEERDSVICYQTGVDIYHYVDILPCYKYYTLQEIWAITNPEILDEFMDWATTEKPLWIVKGDDVLNPELQELLDEKYEAVRSNDYVTFYRLKE